MKNSGAQCPKALPARSVRVIAGSALTSKSGLVVGAAGNQPVQSGPDRLPVAAGCPSLRAVGRTNAITVSARAFSGLAQEEPLSFSAPVVPGMSEAVAEHRWRELIYAFSLEDPRSFPTLARSAFSTDELESLERFIEAVSELGKSVVLNSGSRLTINFSDGAESVDAVFPETENLRGFSVLFRQCYSDEETASFKSVRTAIGRASHELQDEKRQRRLDMIKSWRRAHGKLQAEQLEIHVLRALVAEGKAPADALELHQKHPKQIISLYNYGDLIHFGKRRQEFADLIGAGEFESAWSKMQFLAAVSGLSHFYVGFSLLAEAALHPR